MASVPEKFPFFHSACFEDFFFLPTREAGPNNACLRVDVVAGCCLPCWLGTNWLSCARTSPSVFWRNICNSGSSISISNSNSGTALVRSRLEVLNLGLRLDHVHVLATSFQGAPSERERERGRVRSEERTSIQIIDKSFLAGSLAIIFNIPLGAF